MTINYKQIFEYKKNFLKKSNLQVLGAIAHSFELKADILFIETDNIKLISQISTLRPRAYICIFTDNPKVKSLTAILFGVYCFPQTFIKNPDEFIATFGFQFIPRGRPEACILHLDLDKYSNITAHRITHHKK